MSYEKHPDNKVAIVDGSDKLTNECHSETTFTTEKDIVSEVQLRDPPDGGWKAWLVVVGSFCVSHFYLFLFQLDCLSNYIINLLSTMYFVSIGIFCYVSFIGTSNIPIRFNS